MKVLLVNEASGVHRYLKQGLQELGHEVVLASAGAQIQQGRSADVTFGYFGNSLPGKVIAEIKEHTLPYATLRRFRDYDVANFILGMTALSGRFNRYTDLPGFKKNGLLLSYYGLGCDAASLPRVRADVAEMPCPSCIARDALGRSCARNILGQRDVAARHAGDFDVCVSSVYEYDHCHAFFPDARHTNIPFPIHVSGIEFVPITARPRPLIVHAPTRRGFKGTHVVLEAIEKLRRATDAFEFRLVEGVTHSEYLRTLREADIYVDQVFSESAGIAALENLAMGKIVVSGNGPHARRYFPFAHQSPIIDAPPDAERLAGTLLRLLREKDRFEELSRRGRDYVAQHHDHVQVARTFVDLWSGARKERE